MMTSRVTLRRIALHALLLGLCAAAHPPVSRGQGAAGSAPPRALPLPTGPYAVGRLPFELVDSTRREPTDSAHARVVVGWVWYPAARPAGASERGETSLERALPGEWGDLRAAASATKIGDAAAEAMGVIGVRATTGAPWAPAVGRAPVLVFTPGNGWLPTDYSLLLEDLASHGYAVIGVAPVGLADVVRLRDGRTIRKSLGVGPAIEQDQLHAHRDVRFLLSRLGALDADAGAPWRGHLDVERVGAFGHSLGGTTALVVAATDSMVRAAINLDGDAMGTVTEVRPHQPLLFVSHELPTMREAPPARDSQWTRLTSEGLERSERRRTGEWARMSSRAAGALRLRLLGARHLDFTDAALVATLIEGPERRFMRWGPIEGERALRITADVVRAFFDHTVLGRPMHELLVQPERRYPELRVVPAAAATASSQRLGR